MKRQPRTRIYNREYVKIQTADPSGRLRGVRCEPEDIWTQKATVVHKRNSDKIDSHTMITSRSSGQNIKAAPKGLPPTRIGAPRSRGEQRQDPCACLSGLIYSREEKMAEMFFQIYYKLHLK